MPKRSELKLTKRAVDALEVEGKDAVFWDRDLAGFGVRVHPTGRKVYVVQTRGPGGPKRVTLGRHGKLSTDEARKRAVPVIDRIKRGEAPTPKPPEPALNVSGLAERFMQDHVEKHLKPGTIASYRYLIEKHILPALGGMEIEQVGRAEVSALHHRLCDTPDMANSSLGVLSKMFSLAETWELLPPGNNPCRAVRPYSMRRRERFLSDEEFRRLGGTLRDAEADGSVWPPALAAIRLLMLTGCRKSEILNLRWDDLDHTAGELRLRDAKTGPRMVPLTTPARRVLDGIERSEGNPWVFPGRNGASRPLDITTYWKRIRARAGLDDVRIHDLRHSYASRALALGEGLTAIGKLLGHAKVSTTARYAHLMRDAEKAAAARVGDSIGTHLGAQTTQV